MKDILDILYHVYAENIDSEAIQLTKKIKDKLDKNLNDENKELFLKLMNAQDEAHIDISRESFKQGFCANVKLMFEMFCV